MLPKKYHAIVFIGILVMLLLLGLHLLGIGYSDSQAAARNAALARNSSQSSSSSNINTALSQNQVYRHPIVYDKLTGETNNQINEVLGAKQPPNDYPIDHYQEHRQQQPNQQQQQNQPHFNQLPQDDFFANIHRQAPGFPPLAHTLSHHMHPQLGPPLVQMPPPPPMMTTQSPASQQPLSRQPLQLGMRPLAPPSTPAQSGDQRQSSNGLDLQSPSSSGGAHSADSLPSASSLTNNGARPVNTPLNGTQQQQQQQQQQQPIYYTPPIFAYNNFDQNRPIGEPQANGPFGFPQQRHHQQQQLPSLGVPAAPISIDEYNARQTRLRQLNQQLQQPTMNEVSQSDRHGKKAPQRTNVGSIGAEPQFSSSLSATQPNLLADPQQQQRHKQQMLDRQLLFGNTHFAPETNPNNQTSYYPDPALYRPGMSLGPQASIRPPYAHNMAPSLVPTELELEPQFGFKHQSAQNRIMPLNNRADPSQQQAAKVSTPERQAPLVIKNNNPTQPINQLMATQQSQQAIGRDPTTGTVPLCAKQPVFQQNEQQFVRTNLDFMNSTAQKPVLFCNEDPEYPIKDIMRALETYAAERSIEQLLPQLLVQIQLAQRGEPANRNALSLDSLQPFIRPIKLPQSSTDRSSFKTSGPSDNGQLTVAFDDGQRSQQQVDLFASSNYEPMCRSNVYMAQPRRAKNLLGQWKLVINLPGHKYRGIAVSQMVRVEECSQPNDECNAPPSTNDPTNKSSQLVRSASPVSLQSLQLLPKSRCLQHYENQRLVAWSHQQGLHVDIFRVPIACSCHIRR